MWCNLFCEIRAQNFTPKMGHFSFSYGTRSKQYLIIGYKLDILSL